MFNLRLLLPCTALLAGCLGDIVQPVPVAWEGELEAITPLSISGSLAAVSQGPSTDASIRLTGSEPGAEYEWRIRSGTCADPSGELVGNATSYPPLTANSAGTASAKALLDDPMLSGLEYHGIVSSAGESAPLACADLDEF